jgi:PAS domain S-box-containing protein
VSESLSVPIAEAHSPTGEAALRAALEAGGVGVWELDVPNRRLSVSDVCKGHFGRRPSEAFTYDDFESSVHPDDRERRMQARADSFERGRDYDIELRVVWPDGSVHWLLIRAKIEREAAGRPLRMTGVSLNVTDRRAAQEALRESEERFRLIADSAPVPMWITEPGGSRRFVNKAYKEFLGLSFEDSCAFDWRTILHPDDRERIVRESIAGEASLQPFSLEARYRRAQDAHWRWMRSTSQPRWGPLGEHVGFIGVAHDITEAKQAQADLQRINELLEERVAAALAQKEEAETALRQAQRLEAIGQLTSGVAHDFNNLLTVILGNLERLERGARDAAEQRRLSMMREAADRGAKLTAQLLAFSRQQRLEPRSVEVNATVERLRELLQSSVGGAVRVETRLESAAGCALVDPTQFELVLLNLAINARDAMEGAGVLTVETGRASLGPPQRPEHPPAGDYVQVSVADTGCGMSPAVLERAFEPFFTTKGLGRGSGLGLSQVLGLAKQSGGGVRIDSAPGDGARVTLYLPPGPQAAAEDDKDRPPSASVAGLRVLLVDDDPAVRETAAATLADLGCHVVEAPGGEAALQALKAGGEPPDIALLDLAMPEMNGADLARRIHELRPGLPILFVTGHADAAMLNAIEDAAVIRKPFTSAELAARLAASKRT